MSTTSKSPAAVLRTALAVGEEALRPYSHRFSPKVFTQPQLFACLALKEFLRLDYRKLAATLRDSPEWTRLLGLRRVPHFTTFQKAARRLLRVTPACKLLDQTAARTRRNGRLARRVKLAAIDGTGFESRHVS